MKGASAAVRTAIDAEVALLKARRRLRAEVDRQAYERGLVDLAAHYAARRRTIETEADAEIAALLRQRSDAPRGRTEAGVGSKKHSEFS